MAEMPPKEERAQGFALDLRDGVELLATYVPGRKNPYLGIQKGNRFIALAQFISGEDMSFLREILEKRVFIIQPLE